MTMTEINDIWMTAQRPGKLAELKMDCLLLGGGICGLATAIALRRSGHNVTVLERDPVTDKRGMGGGCRLPPNMTKILSRWGLARKLLQYGSKLHKLHLYVYETGDLLGYHAFPQEMLKEAGGDYVLIQYGDLWQTLYEGALEAGAEVLIGADVTSVNPASSCVTLANGDVLSADLIVGADGPRGLGRQLLLDQDAIGEKMVKGFMMYESVIPAERMSRYPELHDLTNVDHPERIMLYFGEGCAWHFFPISHLQKYAIHYCRDDNGTAGDWGDEPHVRLSDVVGDCEPRIRRLAEIADPAVSIRVPDSAKLEHWVHDSQRLLVIGQAAHPFPPGAQQGIAMALEDAAVLGKLFSHLNNKSQIGNFLYAFEDIRQARCYTSFNDEIVLYRFFSMKKGSQREARDEGLKSTFMEGRKNLSDSEDVTAKQWEEVTKVYAYDCEDEADEWWVKWGLLRQRATERNKFHTQGASPGILQRV